MKLAIALFVLTACASDTFTSGDAGADAADGATCPDESGKYAVVFAGAGCGAFSATSACATQSACTVTLGSSSVDGTFTIDGNGDFTDGTIKEGSASRSGCTGTWNASTSVLTIDCGNFGTSQSCRATLTRGASTCN